MEFSDSLLQFHSIHFSDASRENFLQSIYNNSNVQEPLQETLQENHDESSHLTKEMIQMFRSCEEFKLQQKEEMNQRESVQMQEQVQELTFSEKYGDKAWEIKQLEMELHEHGKQFVNYHVWPVIPLKF